MPGFLAVCRCLFGIILMVLGVDHFAPMFALTFSTASVLPVTDQDARLSAELIAAFRDSGLMGIASAGLIGAGALVIADRLTVLALLVPLPVFFCALYWAVLLEHSSPLVLLILIALAADLRLLVAYRPYIDPLFEKRAKSAREAGTETSAFWWWAEAASRYVWGIWFVWSGTFHFYTSPIFGEQPLGAQLMHALVDTHLYEAVKGVELLGGIAVLARRWAPLGLLINVPITLVVMYWDGYLEGQLGTLGLFIVALTLGFTAVIMWAYRDWYSPLLTWRPQHVWRGMMAVHASTATRSLENAA